MNQSNFWIVRFLLGSPIFISNKNKNSKQKTKKQKKTTFETTKLIQFNIPNPLSS